MSTTNAVGSASIAAPDYWWYRARANLLETVLADYVGSPRRLLDVGSADGPSVDWLRTDAQHISLDVDPRGLRPGGVCGSALSLPFADSTFDVVAAFDVLEHCEPEQTAVAEFARVLTAGGRLLLSVPAYEWAWTDFDDSNGHHRRYTLKRARAALRSQGLEVVRATYAFAGTLPFFAAERVTRRAVGRLSGRKKDLAPGNVPALPSVSPPVERTLMSLCRLDEKLLARRNLPFGSSVVLVGIKPSGR